MFIVQVTGFKALPGTIALVLSALSVLLSIRTLQSVLFHYISFKTLRAFQSGKWSSHRPSLFCLFISDEEEESFMTLTPEVPNGRLHRPLSDDVGLGLNQTLKNESFILTWRHDICQG
jgi:hypothetical protein